MKNTFNDLKNSLSPKDIDEIVSIVCGKCRANTYRRVRSILTYQPSFIPTYSIFSRLTKENDSWEYCPGQSYTDEIRIIREIILKGE